MRLVVGIPTVGRAAILCETLRELRRQRRPADAVIVCGATEADLAGAAEADPDARLLVGRRGLPHQRNAIVDACPDADILVFFDDDFLAAPDYLAAIERHMTADPGIVVATGLVLADGIKGPGLTAVEGREILHAAGDAGDGAAGVHPTFSGYGCNMAVRLRPMRDDAIRFDERLPLYGWQEDVDFSRRLAAHGTVVRLDAARGVHLGTKSGRTAGVRLGYSQVANPIYLTRKRCGYPAKRALEHIARNMASNVFRSPWPEPFVDRVGRLRGNLLALRDLATGRIGPERVLEL